MRNLSLKKVRRAAGEVYGLENAEPASSTVGGHEEKGAARKGALPVVLVVVLVALTLAVGLAGFAVQSAEAQTAGGPVVAWGGVNESGELNVPSNLSGVKAISAGELHSLALKEDGTVVAWGDNRFDHGRVPPGLGGITAIDASVYHNLALDAIAPGPLTSFGATSDDGKVSLSWTNPSDTDFQAVQVLRSTTGYATGPDDASQTKIYEGASQSYEDTNLANGTTYYYTIFARDNAGNWSVGATQTATPQDLTVPTIDSVTPDTTPKPAKRTNVTATFSEAMNEDSLKARGAFTLLKKGTKGKRSTPVAASVSYDPSTRTLTLDPTRELVGGETYTAQITTAAEDAAGNALAKKKTWSFTVKR